MPQPSKDQILPRGPRDTARKHASSDDDADRPRKYLTGPQVLTRYSISDMTLWRWLQDDAIAFPKPSLVVRQRRFWDEKVLREWELQRVRASNRTEAA